MIYSIIGLIFFVVVLLLNIKLKFLNKVNKFACYFLCAALLVGTCFIFYNSYTEGIADKEKLYLATQYLKDMDYDNAKKKLKSLNNVDEKGFVQLTANAIVGKKTNNNSLFSLNMSLAEKHYGNKNREKELIDYINSNIDNNEKYITICSNLADILNLSDKSKNKLDDYYLLESKMISEDDSYDGDMYGHIEEFKTDHQDADDLYKRLVINYHLSQEDYDSALEESKLMLEEKDSKETRYAIAEIISNMAYEDYDINVFEQESDEVEAEQFNKEIDGLEESLRKAIEKEQMEINEEKKITLQKEVERLQKEIEMNYKKINNLNVYKTLNFISKYDDKDANILKAKLYYSIGEMDKAKEMLINLTETENSLFGGLKTNKLAEAYEISENKFNSAIAEEATKDALIISDSIIFADNTVLVNDLEKFIVNDIKYNNTGISITSIDYTEYPKMKLTLDVDKLDEININSETFQVKDTGYEVNYTAQIDEAKGNVVFVVDKSGSMNGQPIDDVKEALVTSIENMDDVKIAVAAYDDDGYLVCDLTSDKVTIKNAVDDIQADGGTDIAAGLAEGIDVLLDEAGSRTIILMTDGQGSGDIENEINRALDNNIVIHTIGYGDQADQILKHIAEKSGGEYLATNNSSEIVYIYDLIKKYIGNNVIISYEVKENQEQLDRYVFAKLINDNKTDKKSYMLKNQDSEINADAVVVNNIQSNGFNVEYMENMQYSTYIYGTNLNKINKVLLNNSEVEFNFGYDESIIINIPQNLPSGIYDLILQDDSNEEYVLKYAIAVGERINQYVIKLGNVEINSDMILLMPDGKYVCTGDNTINSLFYTPFNLVVEPDKVVKNEEEGTMDFGKSGKIYGDGQLFLNSYLYRNSINNRYSNSDNLLIRNGLYEIDCNDILSKNINAD